MINTIVRAGDVRAGAGAASRYGSGPDSGSDQKMQLLAAPAPAPQHCVKQCCGAGAARIRVIFVEFKP
jgi:hypothetical protein